MRVGGDVNCTFGLHALKSLRFSKPKTFPLKWGKFIVTLCEPADPAAKLTRIGMYSSSAHPERFPVTQLVVSPLFCPSNDWAFRVWLHSIRLIATKVAWIFNNGRPRFSVITFFMSASTIPNCEISGIGVLRDVDTREFPIVIPGFPGRGQHQCQFIFCEVR